MQESQLDKADPEFFFTFKVKVNTHFYTYYRSNSKTPNPNPQVPLAHFGQSKTFSTGQPVFKSAMKVA